MIELPIINCRHFLAFGENAGKCAARDGLPISFMACKRCADLKLKAEPIDATKPVVADGLEKLVPKFPGAIVSPPAVTSVTLTPAKSAKPKALGPGGQLKRMLKKIRITVTPDCKCNARASLMDKKGPDWCEKNIDLIVGWLREEASTRQLPFVAIGAKLLIRRAIKLARASQPATMPPV